MNTRKTFLSLSLVFLSLFLSAKLIYAIADDLIIKSDGQVVLVITNNGVLAVSTNTKEEKKSPPATPPAPQPAAKTVPLVPAHVESTVHINPPVNNDKKVQVIITTGGERPSPATNTVRPTTSTTFSQSTATTPNTAPKNTAPATRINSNFAVPTPPITKNVDQVVAQGSNGQPVLTIKSDKARELTIQQGATQVTTTLPLQINTLTHTLSVPSQKEATRISVLPVEALSGIQNKGILDSKSLSGATINLTQDASGVNYTVQSEKQGKLFGVVNVKSPIQVKLSAQNGKILTTSQSILFTVFGRFIR